MVLYFLHTILCASEPFTRYFQSCLLSFGIDAISLSPVGGDLDAGGLGAGLCIGEGDIKMGFIKCAVLIHLFGGDHLLQFADSFDFVLDFVSEFHLFCDFL